MAAPSNTVISAGLAIYDILSNNEDIVAATDGKIVPVASRQDILGDYIIYRRKELSSTPVKQARGPRTAAIEIWCVSREYSAGVSLAEEVCESLDGWSGEAGGLMVRGIELTGASEDVTSDMDRYIQILTFNITLR